MKFATLTRRRRATHLALSAAVPLGAVIAALWVNGVRTGVWSSIVAPLAVALLALAMLSPLHAVVFRGGAMLQAFNIAVVRRDGTEASRQLAFTRAVVAWSPTFVFLLGVGENSVPVSVGGLALLAVGAILAAVTPERGLPDRVLGTWLVRR